MHPIWGIYTREARSTLNRTFREGLRAGILGAAVVAVWFFVVDLVLKRPLYTPLALGRAVLSVVGLGNAPVDAAAIVFYTIFHFAVFSLAATLIAWMLNVSEGEPGHLAGLFLLFVAFEAGFYLYIWALMKAGVALDLAWYQVAIGNLLAAVVMARVLLKAHPGALHEMNEALAGRR